MCRLWLYKAEKPPLRKVDHLSLAIGDNYSVWVAIEYIAMCWAKKINLNFSAN